MSSEFGRCSRRKFCVINCENSKAWSPIDFGDMFIRCLKDENSTDEWCTINVANEEPVPNEMECLKYHGIIITGSRFNVRDRDSLPWFNPLCALIERAANTGSPRIYAGCFGCQIVAHSLGGTVDFNADKRFVLKAETISVIEDFEKCLLTRHPLPPALQNGRIQNRCDNEVNVKVAGEESLVTDNLQLEVEVVEDKFNSLGIHGTGTRIPDISSTSSVDLSNAQEERRGCGCAGEEKKKDEGVREREGEKKTEGEKENEGDCKGCGAVGVDGCVDDALKDGIKPFKIIVSHGDCVHVLPLVSILLGSSSTCTNEMYVTGTHRNIFACQSHPEFDCDYCIKERIWPAVVEQRKRLNEEEIEVARNSFENHTAKDSERLLCLIKEFMNLPCTACVCCTSGEEKIKIEI